MLLAVTPPSFLGPSRVLQPLLRLPRQQDSPNQSGGILCGWALWPWRQAKGPGVGQCPRLLCASAGTRAGQSLFKGRGGKAPGLPSPTSRLKEPLDRSPLCSSWEGAPTEAGDLKRPVMGSGFGPYLSFPRGEPERNVPAPGRTRSAGAPGPGLQIHPEAHGPGSRGGNQAEAVFQLGLPALRARFPEPSSSLDNGHLSSHKGPQNHQEANTSEPRTTASPVPGTQGWRHPRQVFPGALQELWAPSSSLLPQTHRLKPPPVP